MTAPLELFRRCATLGDAITTGLRLAPPWSIVEVVQQDEYTLDVVLQGDPDGPAIVLDCT
jgi:hypothetical protein